MSTAPQQSAERQLRTELLQRAAAIATANIDELVRTAALGTELGFERARPMFESISGIFERLMKADLSLASEAKLGALSALAGRVGTQFDSFKSFRPQDFTNALQTRNQMIDSNLRILVDECFDAIAPVLAFGVKERISSFEEQGTRVLGELLKKTSAADDTLKQLQNTLAKARQAAEEVGIVQHAKFFQEESITHKRAAFAWLVVTFVLAVAAVAVGWWNYTHTVDALKEAVSRQQLTAQKTQNTEATGESPNLALQIQLALAKLIIFSVLFSAVVWAGRMYRAHRHNFVINRHRLNALNTFEAFAKAADDPQVKNAVLLQATQCIFGSQPTGYISADADSDGLPQFVEIFRGIGSSGEKAK